MSHEMSTQFQEAVNCIILSEKVCKPLRNLLLEITDTQTVLFSYLISYMPNFILLVTYTGCCSESAPALLVYNLARSRI
jgi:hypothetical protein